MISVAEARERILAHVGTKASVSASLYNAIGRVLAQDVVSDVDSPPYRKSLVDGFAVRASDCQVAGTHLVVVGRVPAGETPQVKVRPGTAVQIMTGAPLPAETDAVVMVEQTSGFENPAAGQVRIDAPCTEVGQHIMAQGAVFAQGAVVFARGHVVRPVDAGLMMEVGAHQVEVIAPPRVAVLATGNELVAPDTLPSAGRIRNSNGPLLSALASSLYAEPVDLGIAGDRKSELRQAIASGLDHDVLLLSGGVSAGLFDLVPVVLKELGVEPVFHKVDMRPGKPMWFGVRRGTTGPCLVFGLPGNPVGSLVCFLLFVAPALRKLGGYSDVLPAVGRAALAVEHLQSRQRPTYHPAYARRRDDGSYQVTPLSWHGSADQLVIASANSLVLFPPGEQLFAAGAAIDFILFPGQPGEQL